MQDQTPNLCQPKCQMPSSSYGCESGHRALPIHKPLTSSPGEGGLIFPNPRMRLKHPRNGQSLALWTGSSSPCSEHDSCPQWHWAQLWGELHPKTKLLQPTSSKDQVTADNACVLVNMSNELTKLDSTEVGVGCFVCLLRWGGIRIDPKLAL